MEKHEEKETAERRGMDVVHKETDRMKRKINITTKSSPTEDDLDCSTQMELGDA